MQADVKRETTTERSVPKSALRKAGFKFIRYDENIDAYLLSRGRVTGWVSGSKLDELMKPRNADV